MTANALRCRCLFHVAFARLCLTNSRRLSFGVPSTEYSVFGTPYPLPANTLGQQTEKTPLTIPTVRRSRHFRFAFAVCLTELRVHEMIVHADRIITGCLLLPRNSRQGGNQSSRTPKAQDDLTLPGYRREPMVNSWCCWRISCCLCMTCCCTCMICCCTLC
jgi:hypothetical protein